jgi:hypothetical protein
MTQIASADTQDLRPGSGRFPDAFGAAYEGIGAGPPIQGPLS